MTDVKPKGGLKPGTDVVIGGQTYTAPPLNFGALRAMNVEVKPSPTYINDLLAYVLLRSLERNYDGVNALWLNEHLEGHEIEAASLAMVEIMKASGLKPPENKSPEEKQSGEAVAAA